MAFFSGRNANDLGNHVECKKISNAQYYYITDNQPLGNSIGLCAPTTCSISDIRELFGFNSPSEQNILFSLLGSSYTPDQIEIESYQDSEISTTGITFIFLLTLLFIILGVGSYIDYYYRDSLAGKKVTEQTTELLSWAEGEQAEVQPKGWMVFLSQFSVYKSYNNLIPQQFGADQVKDPMHALHGVRVLATVWVILANWLYAVMHYVPVRNPNRISAIVKDSAFQWLYVKFLAVDVFLWMSGLLMAYVIMKEIENRMEFTLRQFLVNRYTRLFKSYLFLLFTSWALFQYLNSGPSWERYSKLIFTDCSSYWWSHILFLNNFLPNGEISQCMPWSWYIALDMQLTIIGSALILLYYRYSRTSVVKGMIGLIVISLICGLGIVWGDDIPVTFSDKGLNQVLSKPYVRMVAYLLGALCGLALYEVKKFRETFEVNDPILFKLGMVFEINWVRWTGVALGFFTIFILTISQKEAYDAFAVDLKEDDWGAAARGIFMTLLFLGNGLAISLIILPMLLGHFPFAYRFLGMNLWYPFSKVSYATYLIHGFVIVAFFSGRMLSFYVSWNSIVTSAVGLSALSFIFGYLYYLIMEGPRENIRKMLRD